MRLSATSWAAQILSNSDWGIVGVLGSAPAQAGAHDREQHGVAGTGVLEAVCQVGIEGDRVAFMELVLRAVDVQRDRAALDHRDLAAARLVHGRIALAAGGGAGPELVARELGTLAGQRRREDLEPVAG